MILLLRFGSYYSVVHFLIRFVYYVFCVVRPGSDYLGHTAPPPPARRRAACCGYIVLGSGRGVRGRRVFRAAGRVEQARSAIFLSTYAASCTTPRRHHSPHNDSCVLETMHHTFSHKEALPRRVAKKIEDKTKLGETNQQTWLSLFESLRSPPRPSTLTRSSKGERARIGNPSVHDSGFRV